MRYRLMASYQDAPFEAGIGPTDQDVVLFAACPPPEDLGFEPATGHWRKRVTLNEVQAVWESRPVGIFRGERCAILDDLGDRLHIGYLGHDAHKAEQLGYWQVDRGVFELVAPRGAVTDINEERVEHDRAMLRAGPGAGGGPGPGAGGGPGPGAVPGAPASTRPPARPDWAVHAQPAPPVTPATHSRWLPADVAAGPSEPGPRADDRRPRAFPATGPVTGPLPYGGMPDTVSRVMLPVTASDPLPLEAEALRAATATRRTRPARSGERQRPGTQQLFADLAEAAGIPSYRYAIGAAVEGAFCLLSSADGYQVFWYSSGARHEQQTFATEEAACFYLFGILAAEALRTGSLVRAPLG